MPPKHQTKKSIPRNTCVSAPVAPALASSVVKLTKLAWNRIEIDKTCKPWASRTGKVSSSRARRISKGGSGYLPDTLPTRDQYSDAPRSKTNISPSCIIHIVYANIPVLLHTISFILYMLQYLRNLTLPTNTCDPAMSSLWVHHDLLHSVSDSLKHGWGVAITCNQECHH